MWKTYDFSRGTPCLPATLLVFVLRRVHVQRDSWGVMGVSARALHFLREVMSRSRGTRGTRRTNLQKEGKKISKTMLLTSQQFSLFGQTVSDPWLNRVALFAHAFCQNCTAIYFVCFGFGWVFAIIALFFEFSGVEWCVTIWLIFGAASGNISKSYGALRLWISGRIKIKFPEVLVKLNIELLDFNIAELVSFT